MSAQPDRIGEAKAKEEARLNEENRCRTLDIVYRREEVKAVTLLARVVVDRPKQPWLDGRKRGKGWRT